jgi:hypothetical protein
MHAATQHVASFQTDKISEPGEYGAVMDIWNMADGFNADETASRRHIYV